MKLLLVYCLNIKGALHNELKEFSKASKNLKEALNICEELKLKSEMCETLSLLARVNCAIGEKEIAKKYLEKGLKIIKNCKGNTPMTIILFSVYVEFHLSNHNYEQAKKTSEKLLDLLKVVKWKNFSYAEALYLMGRSLHGLGEKNKARKYFSRSLSLAQKMQLNPLINKLSEFL